MSAENNTISSSPTAPGVRPVTKIGFFRSFATQSSLQGPLAVETWYGHHAPWRRIVFFWLLITFWGAVDIAVDESPVALWDVPILKWNLPQKEVAEARRSHAACVDAVCETLSDLPPFSCIIGPAGKGARIDHEEFTALPDVVYAPQACYDAVEATVALFGGSADFADDHRRHPLLIIPKGAGLASADDGNDPYGIGVSPPTLHPDCTLGLPSDGREGDFSNLDILQLYPGEHHRSGDRVTIDFRRTALCANLHPDEQTEQGRMVAEFFPLVYDGVLKHRYSFLFGFGAFMWICLSFGYVLVFGIGLLPTTFAARTLLNWPKDRIDGDRITFWSVWRTLLLITVVTEKRDGTFFDAVLVGAFAYGAHRHGDRSAVRGWMDLGLAWLGAPYIYPLLDSVGQKLSAFDMLNVVPFAASVLVPGDGWWKLVRLYAFYRAYGSLTIGDKIKVE